MLRGYPGVPPMVDNSFKEQLRNRSLPLTNEQRANVKKMGIKVKPGNTEKDIVKLLKRIVTGRTNYKLTDTSQLVRKRKTAKPKSMSKRQARIEVLDYRIMCGSNRAVKQLKNI